MPDFLIRNPSTYSQFALIQDNGSLAWKRMHQASGFGSAQQALDAFESACRGRRAQAIATATKAYANRVKAEATRGENSRALRLEAEAKAMADQWANGSNDELSLPQWVQQHWNEKANGVDAKKLVLAERPTTRELLGIFDQYFVRSDRGWLSRPQTSLGSGLEWSDSFSFAVPFLSSDEARRALGGWQGWIVKATGAFTAVEEVNKPGHDDLCGAICAACEARDIRQGLDDAAQGRLQALDAAPARKPRSL